MTGQTCSAAIEEGDPALDARAFRRTLGQFATGVTIIATEADGRPAGVTANSFSSLSLDPPLVLWSIARTSRSFTTFCAAKHFAVSILTAEQIDVSQKLSSASEEKFSDVAWRPGIGGAPLIEEAAATLECSTETIYEGGDHIILIGRVLRYARYPGDVLLYAQGQYGIVEEHPALKLKQGGAPSRTESKTVGVESPISTLLYLAHHYSSAAFEKYRREEGISLAQSRVLNALTRESPMSIDRIAQQIYLTERTAEDAVNELLIRGSLVRDVSGKLSMTARGTELARAIRRKVGEYETELFAGITQEKIRATREVLLQFIDRLGPELSTEEAA